MSLFLTYVKPKTEMLKKVSIIISPKSQLKLLGWLKSKGDICHKANIPIGNNNYIQPDILVRKDGIDQFVIEVKRPVHSQTDRERL